ISTLVRARVPGGGSTRGRIERGDVDARLPADAVEVAAGVNRAPAHRQGEDPGGDGVAIRVRGPGGGQTRCGIEGGDVVAGLPADAGEVAAGVDRAPAHDQGVDGAVRVRVPGGQVAAGIQVSEVVARLPAYRRELLAQVPAPAPVRGDRRYSAC